MSRYQDLSQFTQFLEYFKQKQYFLGSKTMVQDHYFMVYIAYYTEINLQVSNYAQKQRICCENSEYTPHENLYGHFCSRGKAANFCYPGSHYRHRMPSTIKYQPVPLFDSWSHNSQLSLLDFFSFYPSFGESCAVYLV